jgi:Uma2 family endonuclease
MLMPPGELLAQGPYCSVEALPLLPEDGNRYELVHAELLVSPAPSAWHQKILRRLVKAIDRYLDNCPEALQVIAPSEVEGRLATMVQPDLLFVIPKAVARSDEPQHLDQLLLVIEIASSDTLHPDRFPKRRRYQEARIPTYWLLNPEDEVIEVWRPDLLFPEIERSEVQWRAPRAARELRPDLRALFTPTA